MSHTYGSPSNAISIIIIIWVKGICTAIANLPISAEYRDKGLTGDRGPYSTNGQYQEYVHEGDYTAHTNVLLSDSVIHVCNVPTSQVAALKHCG